MDKIKPNFVWGKNIFERINCSFKEGKFPSDMFFHYPNGSYTGPIGMIQRNEVTTMLYPVRPDSLPFSPGLIGPVFAPADVAITYFKNDPIEIKREMTSFVTDFPTIVYAYILIGLLIFAICFMITEVGFTKEFGPKKLMSICEKTGYTLVDQATLDAETTTGRIIKLMILHVTVIFFIHGLFLTKMGADLVVIRDSYSIDSIEELIHNDSITKPIITKQFFLLDLLKQAYVHRPESTLGRMFEIIHSDQERLTYNLDPTQNIETISQRFSDLLNRMQSKEVAYVMPQIPLRIFTRLCCLFIPYEGDKLKLARETFAHGILTFLISRDIDPMVRRKLQYYIQTALETSLIASVESGLSDTFLMMTPITIDTAVVQCQDLHRENAARIQFGEDDRNMWRMFYLHDYYSLFIIVAWFMTAATVILVLELLVDLVSKVVKRRRRFKKAKKRMLQKELKPGQVWRIVGQQIELGTVRHYVIHISHQGPSF